MSIGSTLQDLDLYDNLISHIRGLDHLVHLTSLDLSFNKIKHIKNVDKLKELKDIYFVQNRIQKIENLESLTELRNLELAANRIRVRLRTQLLLFRYLSNAGNREPRYFGRFRGALAGQEQDYRNQGIACVFILASALTVDRMSPRS